MPGRTDDDQRDDQLEDDESESTEEENDEQSSDSDSASDSGDSTDKRLADLTSQRDKETARANKAEAALKAAQAKRGEGAAAGSDDPMQKALMQELREASLDAIYGEFPELRQYGIDRSLIEGSTRADIRSNATSLVGLIKSLKTKVRNETLAEHGIKADTAGQTRQKPVDYASMSDADFEKLLNS